MIRLLINTFPILLRYLFLLFLLLILSKSQAQDQIVTIKGDTFECTITKIDDRFIHFDYVVSSTSRSTVIPLDKVESYVRNKSEAPDRTLPANNQSSNQAPSWSSNNAKSAQRSTETPIVDNWRPVRLAFQGGYSHLLAKGADGISADLKAYEDALRSGWHLGATLSYFTRNNETGVGLKFHLMQTQNSGQFEAFVPDINGNPTLIQFLVEDQISIAYFGPQFAFRTLLGSSGSKFVFGSSIGYASYSNNAYFIDPINIKGGGLGAIAEMNFDFALTTGVMFNFGASIMLNSIRRVTVNGSNISLSPEESINNTHFNAFAGLVFELQ